MQENLLLAHHDLVTRANQVAANLPMRSMRNGFSCDYDWGASPFRRKIVWTNGRKGPPQGMFFSFLLVLYTTVCSSRILPRDTIWPKVSKSIIPLCPKLTLFLTSVFFHFFLSEQLERFLCIFHV